MSKTIDLDALVPASATITFDKQDIEVKPPKTKDILKLGFLGEKLQKAGELEDAELDKLLNDVTAQIGVCIPELAGKEFTTTQLLVLVQTLSKMATPPDVEELNARGVTVGDPKAT